MSILNEIEETIPALRRYARGLVKEVSAADDLVQDCLERAVRKQHLWKPSGTVRAWLFTILLNVHRDHLRRNRKFQIVPLDGLHEQTGIAGNQHGNLALNETLRHIDHLPMEQKQVLLLIALEGFGYSEAATILDIPKGTLMSRLARARATLRDMRDTPTPTRLRTVK